MDNMTLYNAVREVPKEAQKAIGGGRLKGMTDINPMWRIKKLTEQFGPCGIGWRYIIKDKHLEHGANGEIAAFVDIDLYYKDKASGEWSDPIPGTGGAMFVASEKNGLYTDDECYKKALTDAISVACKAIGMGANVYWDKDRTKYDKPTPPPPAPIICTKCGKEVTPIKGKSGKDISAKSLAATAQKQYGTILCASCMEEAKKQAAQAAAQ